MMLIGFILNYITQVNPLISQYGLNVAKYE